MPADLESLPLDDLRRRRDAVRAQEEELSYRRRLLHAQIDLVRAVGSSGDHEDFAAMLAEVLSDGPGGAAGEIRSVVVDDDHGDLPPLPDDLEDLTEQEREDLVARLREEEAAISEQRRELLDELDQLQEELVRRYRRDGVDARQLLRGD